VAVVGLGYVGLPLALFLVSRGAFVIGVDKREKVREGLLRGSLPIYEPGLHDLLRQVCSKNLHLMDLAEAVASGDIIVICVGTPTAPNGKPIFSDLKKVTESIGRALEPGKAVIVRSTVLPGTTERIIRPNLEKPRHLRSGKDFALAYCPERLVEGKALAELENVPHIVGAADELGFRVAKGFFNFVGGDVIRAPTLATAEMAKLLDNVYRDTNIALANEFALVCEAAGVDVLEAIRAANSGPRTRILTPGCGVGGSCLTKDPLMLGYLARTKGIRTSLMAAARSRNRQMPIHMIDLVESAFEEMHKRIAGSRLVVMGLAFKGETDDIRQSTAIPIVRRLSRMNAHVVGYDPYVSVENAMRGFGKLALFRDPFEAAKDSDCIIITADHRQLREIKPNELIKVVRRPSALIDGRNVFDKTDVVKAGFIFRGIGRSAT
jgi:UDP-N-acetyl-D-mannosaminuronic acid dehydrogenase